MRSDERSLAVGVACSSITPLLCTDHLWVNLVKVYREVQAASTKFMSLQAQRSARARRVVTWSVREARHH